MNRVKRQRKPGENTNENILLQTGKRSMHMRGSGAKQTRKKSKRFKPGIGKTSQKGQGALRVANSKPKKPLLSPGEMTAAVALSKENNKLQAPLKNSEKSAEISKLIANQRVLLNNSLQCGRVSLRDENFEEVVFRVQCYFDSCEQAGVLPSFTGVAVFGLGMTARGLRKHLTEYPNSSVSRYLELVRDGIGDLILQSGSKKITSEILTIFALRNAHGFTNEEQPLSGLDNDDSFPETVTEIMNKYAGIGDD